MRGPRRMRDIAHAETRADARDSVVCAKPSAGRSPPCADLDRPVARESPCRILANDALPAAQRHLHSSLVVRWTDQATDPRAPAAPDSSVEHRLVAGPDHLPSE